MKSFTLLHQLLNLVETLELENDGREVSLQDCAGFLLSRVGGPLGESGYSDARFGKEETYVQTMAFQLDNSIGRLFVYMSRYAKSYFKDAGRYAFTNRGRFNRAGDSTDARLFVKNGTHQLQPTGKDLGHRGDPPTDRRQPSKPMG